MTGDTERGGYLDAASAAPLHPAAREAYLAALADGWADPTRLHREGRRARLLLDAARESLAQDLGVGPGELVLCPSGAAAAQLAVAGTLAGRRRVGGHVVHSAVEHSAVLIAVAGQEATAVAVDREGLVDPAAFDDALRPDTALACLIGASHEVGTVQPVEEVGARCAAAGVPLFVDAAQTVGWGLPPSGWSLLSASAHKWGGPPGVGLLAVRAGTRFAPGGADAEGAPGGAAGAGAVDLPAVVAAAAALRAVRGEAPAEDARLRRLVDLVRAEVPATVPDTEVVGHPTLRLPHLVTFSVLYVNGESLVTELDREGFSVSSGSSCTASTLEPSHVLVAMGVLTHGNVRLSLHRGTSEADVRRFLDLLPGVVRRLRADSGAAGL